ncbi:hypothetical protein [Sphaerisporangium sp. TRM90804]|uniref:hypothetical protein n=1 Tax=Sphaerisporangium sp. TRM90804 TaxID=3031113 RepID=UPI00244D6B2E|nr:hypothetical protein [Sphaerisporangium sp. TRM90804]MDH2427816.1 hypothetical protein [Sphaerisporangium sp. TRM90804]
MERWPRGASAWWRRNAYAWLGRPGRPPARPTPLPALPGGPPEHAATPATPATTPEAGPPATADASAGAPTTTDEPSTTPEDPPTTPDPAPTDEPPATTDDPPDAPHPATAPEPAPPLTAGPPATTPDPATTTAHEPPATTDDPHPVVTAVPDPPITAGPPATTPDPATTTAHEPPATTEGPADAPRSAATAVPGPSVTAGGLGRARAARARIGGRLGDFGGRHRWFLAVFALGAALRALAMLGYRPAIWFPDSYTYVVTALRPRPDLVRPAGYSMFLRALEPLHSFGAVVFAQHLLGLATGVLVYAAVVRWGGRRWAAAAAAVPVLLDAYQIELEHLLVSDSLFMFLVAAAVVTGMGARTWRAACAAGLLLAAATVTRTVGLPLIAIVAAWVLLHRTAVPAVHRAVLRLLRRPRPGRRAGEAGIRGRAWLAGVVAVAAMVPVLGYAGWFAATYHRFGIVGSNGVFLYARAMSFADCERMRPPADLATLCDPTPPALRPPSQEYVWAPEAPLVQRPGITFTRETDELAGRFAFLAIRTQPLDYARSVLSELSRSFTWGRPVYPDREIYDYYEFPEHPPPPPGRYPAMAGAQFALRYERGPIGTAIAEPFAGWIRAYQDVARLPGAVLLIVLLVPPVVAAAGRRRARPASQDGPAGAPWTLPWGIAATLLVIPAATAEFDYRYVLPAVPLACLAAALMTRGQGGRSGASLPGDSMNIV